MTKSLSINMFLHAILLLRVVFGKPVTTTYITRSDVTNELLVDNGDDIEDNVESEMEWPSDTSMLGKIETTKRNVKNLSCSENLFDRKHPSLPSSSSPAETMLSADAKTSTSSSSRNLESTSISRIGTANVEQTVKTIGASPVETTQAKELQYIATTFGEKSKTAIPIVGDRWSPSTLPSSITGHPLSVVTEQPIANTLGSLEAKTLRTASMSKNLTAEKESTLPSSNEVSTSSPSNTEFHTLKTNHMIDTSEIVSDVSSTIHSLSESSDLKEKSGNLKVKVAMIGSDVKCNCYSAERNSSEKPKIIDDETDSKIRGIVDEEVLRLFHALKKNSSLPSLGSSRGNENGKKLALDVSVYEQEKAMDDDKTDEEIIDHVLKKTGLIGKRSKQKHSEGHQKSTDFSISKQPTLDYPLMTDILEKMDADRVAASEDPFPSPFSAPVSTATSAAETSKVQKKRLQKINRRKRLKNGLSRLRKPSLQELMNYLERSLASRILRTGTEGEAGTKATGSITPYYNAVQQKYPGSFRNQIRKETSKTNAGGFSRISEKQPGVLKRAGSSRTPFQRKKEAIISRFTKLLLKNI